VDSLKESIILDMIDEYRSEMSRLGGRKLHYLVNNRLPVELQMGRDAFFSLLRRQGYLLRMHKYRVRTTYSYHHYHKYKNLIVDFVPASSCQLFVSDITYIPVSPGVFYYLSLVTDAYSRKIVGWALSERLDAKAPLEALEMALAEVPEEAKLIHHSDRGVQYCSHAYVKMLMDARVAQVAISMTEGADPRENAIAERVNGILKMEWLNHMKLGTVEEARIQIARVIDVYNNKRPHSSIGMLTPAQAHTKQGSMHRKWKNYDKKTQDQQTEIEQNVLVLPNGSPLGS
jgi:transposase InsO family protein